MALFKIKNENKHRHYGFNPIKINKKLEKQKHVQQGAILSGKLLLQKVGKVAAKHLVVGVNNWLAANK